MKKIQGVPIGACLIDNSTGKVLGVGRNRRVQDSSNIHHGETNCLENVGRLPGKINKNCTIVTTLSACEMCTGTILMFGIPRVVMGENESWLSRGEQTLKERGVEVINVGRSVPIMSVRARMLRTLFCARQCQM